MHQVLPIVLLRASHDGTALAQFNSTPLQASHCVDAKDHPTALHGVLHRADSRYTSRLAIADDASPMKPAPLKPNLLIILAGLALALANLSAFAKGDPVEGKKLIYTCTGCHGIPGYKNAYPNYHVPRLGGQNEQYLVNALTEYKKGERNHPTMHAQAESFSAQDIANIASYLSSLGTH